MRWTAVVNPGAGRRGRARDLARLGDALTARAIAIHVTTTAEAGLDAARRAFARDEGVLACGGDGTIRALAGLAAECDGLLGVVPLGAGNDFARELGVDHGSPLAALAAIDRGREVRVDLGRASSNGDTAAWFTTVAHSGLDGEVNRWANSVHRLSGTTLYAIAALRTMAVYQATDFRIAVDGSEWEGRAWLVAVANTHCYGGGMQIAPTASVIDGRLEVVVVGDITRAELIVRFPQMIRGRHLGIGGIHTFSGAVVEIDGPIGVDLYASGERIGPLPASLEVVPSALRVMVPETSPLRRLTTP